MNNEATSVVRIPGEIHRRAKVLAARQGIALSVLAAEALERELTRREARELRRLAVAPVAPTQTR
jgi:predicted transcriptional regulator